MVQINAEVGQEKERIPILLLILGLRSGLFLVELGLGLRSHSISLLAGSSHLFLDIMSLSLTLLAIWIVRHQEQLNYRRISAWVGLGNGLSLGAIALLIAINAVRHFQSPEPILGLPMLIGATLSLIVNGLSTYLLHEDSHNDLNVRGVFLHGLADAANAIALMLTAVAVYFFNLFWADTATSLFVACSICFNAILLVRDSLEVLSCVREDSRLLALAKSDEMNRTCD